MIGVGLLVTATAASLLQQWAMKSRGSQASYDEVPEASERQLPPSAGPMPAAKPGRRAAPTEGNAAPPAAAPPAPKPPPLVNQVEEREFRLGSPYKVGKQAPAAKPAGRPAPAIAPAPAQAPAPPAMAPPAMAPPSAVPSSPPSYNPRLRPASGVESRV